MNLLPPHRRSQPGRRFHGYAGPDVIWASSNGNVVVDQMADEPDEILIEVRTVGGGIVARITLVEALTMARAILSASRMCGDIDVLMGEIVAGHRARHHPHRDCVENGWGECIDAPGAAEATPIKEWAWRDPRNGFVQPVADMDAVMMAGRRIGRPIDVLTRTYPAGTTPPEWNLVSPLDMSAWPTGDATHGGAA